MYGALQLTLGVQATKSKQNSIGVNDLIITMKMILQYKENVANSLW